MSDDRTAVDNAIEGYLSSLQNNQAILSRYTQMSREEFMRSQDDQYVAKHALQLALQSVIFITDCLAPSSGDGNSDGRVERAVEMEIIPPNFADTLKKMVGMRNRLVKKYPRLDVALVYKAVQEDLGCFDDFTGYVASYLERAKTT